MRKFAVVIALGAALALTPTIFADATAGARVQQVQAKAPKPVKGTISSVSDDSIVVSVLNKTTGDKKDRTFKTDSSTKITLDGKDAKLTDLKAGQTVSITRGQGRGAPILAADATTASSDSTTTK